jgi:hypothetical protein
MDKGNGRPVLLVNNPMSAGKMSKSRMFLNCILNPKDGDRKLLRDAGNLSLIDTPSYTR